MWVAVMQVVETTVLKIALVEEMMLEVMLLVCVLCPGGHQQSHWLLWWRACYCVWYCWCWTCH